MLVLQDVKLAASDRAVPSHVIVLVRLHVTPPLEGASVPPDDGDRDVRKVMASLKEHILTNMLKIHVNFC